jgi:hypothetical protein
MNYSVQLFTEFLKFYFICYFVLSLLLRTGAVAAAGPNFIPPFLGLSWTPPTLVNHRLLSSRGHLKIVLILIPILLEVLFQWITNKTPKANLIILVLFFLQEICVGPYSVLIWSLFGLDFLFIQTRYIT